MITELLNTEIEDLDTLEGLPNGAGVVSIFGDLYQLSTETGWHCANASDHPRSHSDLLRSYGPLTLVWIPPEARS